VPRLVNIVNIVNVAHGGSRDTSPRFVDELIVLTLRIRIFAKTNSHNSCRINGTNNFRGVFLSARNRSCVISVDPRVRDLWLQTLS
jgi:hypothetical protein